MKAPAPPTALALATLRPDLLAAERARRSFPEFVRQAWHLVEPETPLVWGWYLDAICLHLEAFARGEIRWLVINVPPRHLKTSITSILWPAWVWTWRPSWRLFASTYGKLLSADAARKARALVESPWYRTRFAEVDGWELAHDSNQVGHYTNTAGGHRFSTSVDAGTTGYGGDDILFDDLLNAIDAHSEASRATAAAYADMTLATRRNDPRTGGAVVIAQRLHERDPIGHLLSKGDAAKWQQLRLPTEYDPERPAVTYRLDGSELWRDPRTQAGELLLPERFGPAEVAAAKVSLASYGYAAQHQQRPSPAGGGMFKRAAWRFHKPDGRASDQTVGRPAGCYPGPAEPLPDRFDKMVISVDCSFKSIAASAGGDPDYVAIHVWGRRGARSYLLDRVHAQMGFGQTMSAVLNVVLRWPDVRRRIIEDKANGPAVIETLGRAVSGLIPIEPRGGKEARAWAIQPQQEAGNLYLPDGAPFLEEFLGEFDNFPKGANDDDVDACTQALLDLDDPASGSSWAERWGNAYRSGEWDGPRPRLG